MKFILGLVIGLLILPIFAYLYLSVGNPPVAVADQPFPFEKQIVKVPLHARIDKDAPKTVPIAATAANFAAGAQIYHDHCAVCHGVPGQTATIAPHMYPPAPQLWHSHRKGVVGVSDDPAGETYWKVDNGIRLTGMPAFGKILSSTQMWQVSVLLHAADQPMPPAVTTALQAPLNPAQP